MVPRFLMLFKNVIFIRYVLVGCFLNTIGFIFYLLMTNMGTDPKYTISFLYPFGFFVSYMGNKNWTFSNTSENRKPLIRFSLMHLFGYLFNLVVLYVCVDLYGFNHKFTQVLAMIFLVFYFFIALKMYVFKNTVKKEN
jgi:putative flippase GtrA